jgi:hypothetical protein
MGRYCLLEYKGGIIMGGGGGGGGGGYPGSKAACEKQGGTWKNGVCEVHLVVR